MNDFIKLVLPLLGVVLTSVVGYFLTDVTKELREGGSVVYSVRGHFDGSATYTLSNVSRIGLNEANFQITCIERPCFRPGGPQGRIAAIESSGNIAGQDVLLDIQHTSLVSLRVTLMPGARTLVRLYPVRRGTSGLLFLYRPAAVEPQSIRLLEASSPAGFVVLNYIEMLAWAFIVSLGLVLALIVVSAVSLARQWRRPPPVKDPAHDPIRIVVQLERRPSGPGRPGG